MLADKEKDGLQIKSLQALDFTLIQKGNWRFVHESSAMWVKLIKEIYRENLFNVRSMSSAGVWSRTVGSINNLHDSGINPYLPLVENIRGGHNTKFWYDYLLDSTPLKD